MSMGTQGFDRRHLIAGVGVAASSLALSSTAFAERSRLPVIGADTGSYSPVGSYLDYAARGNIAAGSNVKLDTGGVIQVRRGSEFVYNPVTIAQYGLQQFTYYLASRSAKNLHSAVVQAGWLISNRNAATGCWAYNYPFGVGGMSETLKAGWYSAMAQGQAISLLTRIYSVYPKNSAYLSVAKRAIAALSIPVSSGGLVADFMGHPYLEEYPTTTAPTLALNGFMFTMIGLYDLSTIPDTGATAMFDSAVKTLRFALPFHDMVTTSAYHLGHLTKPSRPVHHAAHYHRIHVTQLDALYSATRDTTLKFYADLWRTYSDMDPSIYARPNQSDDISGVG